MNLKHNKQRKLTVVLNVTVPGMSHRGDDVVDDPDSQFILLQCPKPQGLSSGSSHALETVSYTNDLHDALMKKNSNFLEMLAIIVSGHKQMC